MPQPPAQPDAVVGQPVSPDDQMWLDAAAELAPDKSVARIEDNAKYLLGGVAVIGALLTGLGVFTSDRVAAHPVALLPTVALTAASLAAAALALVPHGGGVSIDDVASIRRFYEGDIKARGRLVRAAGVLFGLSLLATSIPAIVISTGKQPAPAGPYVAADLVRKGNRLTLAVQVRAVHLAPDAYVTTFVTIKPRGGYLLQDRETADASGAVNASASLDVPGSARTVQIVSAALSGGKTIGSKRLSLVAR